VRQCAKRLAINNAKWRQCAKRLAREKKSPEGLRLSFHFFMLALKVKENCARKRDAKN
jgi:hypothetical protein